MSTNEKEIKELLKLLQEGYTKRDPNFIDTFMEIYSKEKTSLIIGINQQEVFRGYEGAKELFLNDWREWGDVKFDLETPDVQVNEETAWVFMDAKVKMTFPAEFLNKFVLQNIKGIIENEETSDKAKMLDVLTFSALTIVEQAKGDIFDCPIRVSLVLAREEEKWLIQHMHFSFPTKLFPSVRNGEW